MASVSSASPPSGTAPARPAGPVPDDAPAGEPLAARVPSALDLLVVAVVAFPTTMDAWWNTAGSRQADWLTYALLAVQLVALPWRRRWPLPVTLLCAAALSGWFVLGHHGEALNLPTMVGLYTLAVQGDRRTSVIAGVVGAAWSGGLAELAGNPVGSPVLEMAWPAVPLLLGEAVRGRRELLAEYADRAARAEAEREQEGRRRVQDERLRIARDLHDVVAHTLVAVNVHMGVAAQALEARPDVAGAALAQARASSREALAELRAAVTVLRGPDDAGAAGGGAGGGPAPTEPAPGLARLPDLVARTCATGLAVVLADRTADVPDAPEVPAVVGLAAYRIVQEALANVVRHADATTATVTLAPTPDRGALTVEVVDDGRGDTDPASDARPGAGAGAGGGGFGLVGMAERAAALGGTVTHGPRPAGAGGGFRVHVTLPLGHP